MKTSSCLFWWSALLGVAASAPSPTSAAEPCQADLAPRAERANASSSQYPSSLREVLEGPTRCAMSNGLELTPSNPPLYHEAHRPQFHFSPSSNFMNDPNGLVYSGGLWHLFYQYNPTAPVAGNQHWGHAVSKDLYAWQNLPPAIAPANEDEGIFSGSAVIDANNTSGFFDDQTPPDSRLVAIYTLNTPQAQTQQLAYSRDGITFTKHNQTVLSINSTQFRDPKVFWDERQRQWVMTIAHPQEYAVVFYASPDLQNWRELSRFGPAGILGYQYECPDLVQIPIEGGPQAGQKRWVLVNSINPGSPMGGSIVQYWVGDWNGTQFTATDRGARWADFAKDYYAFQSWSNAPDGKAYGIAWASNWQYTNVVPTAPFRSIQSLPRELTLKYYRPNPMFGDLVLSSKPAQLDAIRGSTLFQLEQGGDAGRQNHTVQLEGNGGFEITATFVVPANATVGYNTIGSFEIFSSSGKQSITAGIQMGEPTAMFIDRGNAGPQWARGNPFFTDKSSGIVRYASNYTDDEYLLGPLPRQAIRSSAADEESSISLRAVVDRTVLEVWANEGELSGTSVFFFDNDEVPARVTVSIGDDVIRLDELEVRQLNGTWPDCP